MQPVIPLLQTCPERGPLPSVPFDVHVNGRNSLDRIISRIESASHSIVINMFIWRDDPAGNRVAESLLNAAERGVEVIIAKDKLGALFELGEENRQSFFHKKYGPLIALKQRVINAYSSNPELWSWVVQRPNELLLSLKAHQNVRVFDEFVRNDHSKFTIVDDAVLFVGGMNFEERIVSKDATGLAWRDYMIECKERQLIDRLKARLSGSPRDDSTFDFILNDSRGAGRFEIKPCIVELLDGAIRTCSIEMAYFCDPVVRDSVIAAAGRGVNVQIIIPALANIQNERNLRTMREIFTQSNGAASIYLSPDMLHSKMMDIDGRVILIGSANFNERALSRFSELNVLLPGDSAGARTIRQTFAGRRDASRKVTSPGDLRYRRVKERCEYIFG